MLPGEDRRLRQGHPWAYANELQLDSAARSIPAGSIVSLAGADGRPIGAASFNLHSLIAARVYSRQPRACLDRAFFAARLAVALNLRQKFYATPYYRLVHAEGDGLPGFVVDRYGDVAAVQSNTAGADHLLPELLGALDDLLAPRAVVLRNDSPVRTLEGLGREVRLVRGSLEPPAEVVEGGCRFPADLLGGQKTGWFFDLAEARTLMARLAAGGRMLDAYCHTGAFAVRAASAGATAVLGIDRSEAALAMAEAAAAGNGVGDRCRFRRGDAFDMLERLAADGERFQSVVADPPSFVKSRKELRAGARGYRKLSRLVAPLVEEGGFMFIASCSHHVPVGLFAEEVATGLAGAGRQGRVVAAGGAGPDHPVHAMLPESAYLKWQVLQLD
jgi:23S rRNA (cytosine1962-C5)-methyltransferase